ncbi:MAG: polysaccharide deacetylase family protein [Candidatus Udaeobacter sp.]
MSTIAATEFLPLVATAAATRGFMVVSLHDVAPSSQQIADTIISELARRGVGVCSLLVVPDYHHEGLFTKNQQFVSWLRALEADGHEIVIHGYFHERPSSAKESLYDKFFTRFYTQQEGEFYDLNYEEALRRITTAQEEFRASGLKPRGFVAPAWLLNKNAERAARDAGLEYTTRLHKVCDLRAGGEFAARSIVYSVRKNWRRGISQICNATLFRYLEGKSLLRISLHPPDYSHPPIWRQVTGMIEKGIGSRTATTYQDWITQQRLRRGN